MLLQDYYIKTLNKLKVIHFKSGVHFLSVVCGIARLELRHATTTKKVFLSLEL